MGAGTKARSAVATAGALLTRVEVGVGVLLTWVEVGVAIVAVAAAGCGGQVGLEGDTWIDGDVPLDTAVDTFIDTAGDTVVDTAVDTATDTWVDAECPMPVTWHLETRMIESVELLDGTARMGATQRLLVSVRLLSGCEGLAGVMVDLMPGDATDFVGLLASAWVLWGVDCPPVAPLVDAVVSVPGRGQSNFNVVVTDLSASGGGLRLTYGREDCTDPAGCWCAPEAPPGPGGEWGWCETDCDCGAGLSCIGYWGVAGPLWNCARTCSGWDPRDCYPGDECLPPIPDGAPYVCSDWGEACGEDEPCAIGFACEISEASGWVCRDIRTPSIGIACECDAQCPNGHICVQDAVVGSATCQIPCTTVSSCPVGGWDPMVCTNQWVCTFAD